jgi:transcriptional regulator with XRE-family HTH domain
MKNERIFEDVLRGNPSARWFDSKPGAQLRAARDYRGMSQRALAERSGIDQATISRLEAGCDARFSTWRRLFAVLGFLSAFALHESSEEAADLCSEEMGARLQRMADKTPAPRRRP